MADERRAGRPASPEHLARQLSDLADITDIAEELGLMGDIGLGDTAETVFDYLDATRWSLAEYALRGERTSRLVNAPNPLVEVAIDDQAGGALDRSARAIRSRAAELAEQVRHTNTVVARWLVAHRVAVANPCYLDSNLLLNRHEHGDLDPSALSEDPLYLLVCHLQDVLDAADRRADVDGPALTHLRAQLTLPLRAVQHEMVAAMAYHAAAIAFARAVSQLEAG